MIYTYEEHPPCPCRVYDANGLEIHNCLIVETESGWVVQQERKDGVPVEDEKGEIIKVKNKYAPPLLVVPDSKWEENEEVEECKEKKIVMEKYSDARCDEVPNYHVRRPGNEFWLTLGVGPTPELAWKNAVKYIERNFHEKE